jgi:hypothetical protein
VRIVGRCPGGREARRVLRAHGLLALLGDRRFGAGGRAVPFFGTPARLPAAPIAPRPTHRRGARAGLRRAHRAGALPRAGRAAGEHDEGPLEALAAVLERYVRAPSRAVVRVRARVGRERMTTRAPVSRAVVLVPAYNAARHLPSCSSASRACTRRRRRS